MQKRTKNITINHVPDIPANSSSCICYSQDTYSPSDLPITHLHFHDCLEIGYCYEGSGIFMIDGNIVPFSANNASIIFKNQIHIAQSNKGNLSKWRFVSLFPEQILSDFPLEETSILLSTLINGHTLPNILCPLEQPKLNKLILLIIEELDNKKLGYESYIKLLILQLVFEISRINHSNTPESFNRQTILLITPALEYISNNYMNNIEISHLADVCFTSTRNLRRLFTKAFNLSPLEYIIKYRIKMASVLLTSTNDSILEISNKVGFSSISSFNRNFKTIMGMSPLKWLKSKKA